MECQCIISLFDLVFRWLQSTKTPYTDRPQGVNYHGYLMHILKYLLLLLLSASLYVSKRGAY